MNKNTLKIAIIALTVATALIHIALALPSDILFYLNGLGYLTLLAALYLPQFARYHNLARWALMAFAAVTILAWILIATPSLLGYIDKTIEVLLIVLLFIDSRQRSG